MELLSKVGVMIATRTTSDLHMIPEESLNPLSKEPTPEEVIVIFHPMITKAAKNIFNSTSLPFVYRIQVMS